MAAEIPTDRPTLGVGGDLKGSVTLVVGGQAIVGPHLGDLEHLEAFEAFRSAITDLITLYNLEWSDVLVAHDLHPHYRSTIEAMSLPAGGHLGVQHHRAHVASVLAERGEWHRRVLGVCADGTGFGDDGTIWGGEFFVGSVAEGFDRVLHLRTTPLPGGDSSARWPVMAAAGFLSTLDDLPDLLAEPFRLPQGYHDSRRLLDRGVRTFPTSSVGRLFDAAAALTGFTRENTFEGQAAIWLEHLARSCDDRRITPYPLPMDAGTLDPRPLLRSILRDRLDGRGSPRIARAVHLGIAQGLAGAIDRLCKTHGLETVVLSGGDFQNDLLLGMLSEAIPAGIDLWTNRIVPPNDGGISLGQVALAAFSAVRQGGGDA
jgi:hydrogenase maturation protein HypF